MLWMAGGRAWGDEKLRVRGRVSCSFSTRLCAKHLPCVLLNLPTTQGVGMMRPCFQKKVLAMLSGPPNTVQLPELLT